MGLSEYHTSSLIGYYRALLNRHLQDLKELGILNCGFEIFTYPFSSKTSGRSKQQIPKEPRFKFFQTPM